MSSLQGENSVSLYLRLSCCQLRFRFCLPIIASFDLFSFAKGAELESTHAHNCVARSVHPTCACVYARHRCLTSPALLSVIRRHGHDVDEGAIQEPPWNVLLLQPRHAGEYVEGAPKASDQRGMSRLGTLVACVLYSIAHILSQVEIVTESTP